jgi:hypothetical protein
MIWRFKNDIIPIKSIDPDIDGNVELYNLKDDLGQQNNLAKQYPEKLSEMKQLLKQAHQPNDYLYFGKPKPPKKKKPSVKKG